MSEQVYAHNTLITSCCRACAAIEVILPPPTATVLFTFEQVTFWAGALLMLRTYRRYGFEAYRYMALSFGLWAVSSSFRLLANMFESNEMNTVTTLWQVMNLFLILGIVTTFYSFFYYQHNRLPARTNIASLLGGGTIVAYCNPDWFSVSRDLQAQIYAASYSPVVNLFAVPLIVLFILVFLRPIFRKFRRASSEEGRKEALSLLLVLSFLLGWAAASGLTGIPLVRIARPFLFVAGWMVWIVLTSRRPLTLIFSERSFDKVLVMTSAGYPILLYDFQEKRFEDPSLFSALFSALETAMSNLIETQSELQSIYYENKVITIEKRADVFFFGIGDEPDTALEAALRVFADLLLQYHSFSVEEDGAVFALDLDEDVVTEIVEQSFGSVTV